MQRKIIQFSIADVKLVAIHRDMMTIYGLDCVPDKSIKIWNVRFRAGRECLVDNLRLDQGSTVITVDLIQKLDDLVRSDCNVTLRMLAEKSDASVRTVWTIVHDRLRYCVLALGSDGTH